MDREKITSFFPPLSPAAQVFLSKNSVIAVENSGEEKEINFNKISEIAVQPYAYKLMIFVKNVQLKLADGSSVLLCNLSASGTNKLIEKVKETNPNGSITKSEFEFGTTVMGVAIPADSQNNLSSETTYVILAIVVIAFLIFLFSETSLIK